MKTTLNSSKSILEEKEKSIKVREKRNTNSMIAG